jgi:YVTN family beta-propeller protein
MAFCPHVIRLGLILAALGISSSAAAQPFAYVLGDRSSTNDIVTVFDTRSLAKVTSIPVGNGSPSNSTFGGGIVTAPDGGRVYVVNSDDQTISVISTVTNVVIGTFPAGPSATGIVVSSAVALDVVGTVNTQLTLPPGQSFTFSTSRRAPTS